MIQQEKLQRLREADEKRKDLIERGQWPTPEQPDPTAEFVARADVTPEPIAMTRVPPLPPAPEPGETPEYPNDLEALRDEVVALYRLHAPLEADVGRLFEQYHALELAEFPEEPIPLSRALRSTSLELPRREDIEPSGIDIGVRSANDGRLAEFRERVDQTTLNADEMLDSARRWLALAQSTDLNLADKFGEQYENIPAPVPYYGAYLDPKLLKQVKLERLDMDPPVALATAAGGERGLYFSEWVSLNRWYIIGPFTRGRARTLEDLQVKFPPEVGVERGVDLTATPRDPVTQQVRTWKYRDFGPNGLGDINALEGGKRLEPYSADNREHAVWYFYTQVYSAEEMTVVGSFASDDFGVCWVNGKRVYQSPPAERPWEIFTMESFRVVPLKKGVNEFLFKLENARGTTGTAVLLMTYHDPDLVAAIKANSGK